MKNNDHKQTVQNLNNLTQQPILDISDEFYLSFEGARQNPKGPICQQEHSHTDLPDLQSANKIINSP